MQIIFIATSNELSITWAQELSSVTPLVSSSEARYHHRPMFWYQQPKMTIKIL
jgi:hypothetical protein